MRLYGSVFEPKDHEPTTFLALPQTASRFTAETHLTVFDDENGDEAGLCVYCSDSCYAQVCLNNFRGEHRVKLRFQLRSHRWLMVDKRLTNRIDQIWLRLTCDGQSYRFYYSLNGDSYQLLDQIEASLLSPSISGTRADPLVGMFAFTGTTKFQAGYFSADFDYFDFQVQ